MNELQYLREEYRKTEEDCSKISSTMLSFVTSALSGILLLITGLQDLTTDKSLPLIVIPMVFFVCSVYVFASATIQNRKKLYMLYLRSYIACFHNHLPKKETNTSSFDMWEQLSNKNAIDKDKKERLSWGFAEHLISMVFLMIFHVSYFVLTCKACDCKIIVYDVVIFVVQLVFLGVIIYYSCRKKQQKEMEKFRTNWIALGKEQRLL